MLNSIADNRGQHLHRAVDATTCKKHKADVGMPCWVLPSNNVFTNNLHYAICGSRIRSAGYVGKISEDSMRTKAPMKIKDGERKPFKKKPNTRPLNFSGK